MILRVGAQAERQEMCSRFRVKCACLICFWFQIGGDVHDFAGDA